MDGQQIFNLIISIAIGIYNVILLKDYFYYEAFKRAKFDKEKPRDFYLAAIGVYFKDNPKAKTARIFIINILLLIFIPTKFLMRILIIACLVILSLIISRKKINDSMQENIDKYYKNVKIKNFNDIDYDNYYKILITILNDDKYIFDAQKLLDLIDLIVKGFEKNQYEILLSAVKYRATIYAKGTSIFMKMLNPYDANTYMYKRKNSELAKRLLYVCGGDFDDFTVRFKSLLDDKEYKDIKKRHGYDKPNQKSSLSQEKSNKGAIEKVINEVSVTRPDLSAYSEDEKKCIEIVGLNDYKTIKEQHVKEFGEQEWENFKNIFISECMRNASESLDKIKNVKSIYVCIFPYWDMPNDMTVANKYFGTFLLALNKLDDDYKEIMEYTEKARKNRAVNLYKKSVWLNTLQDISHKNQDFEQLRQMVAEKGGELNVIYDSKQIFRAVHFDGASGNRTYCIVYFHI